MENKLSNYLSSTIKTNYRPKYNYLSEYNAEPTRQFQSYQSYNKIKYSDYDVNPKKNIVALSELHQPSYTNNRVADFSKKLDEEILKEKNTHTTKKAEVVYEKKASPKKFKPNKENLKSSRKKNPAK